MRPVFYSLTALLFLAVFSGCATSRMNADYDRDVDFDGYRSFAWLSDATSDKLSDPIVNAIVEKRFRRVIGDELAAKGFQLVQDQPDFFMTYHVSVDNDEDVVYTYGDQVHPYSYHRGFYFLGGISLQGRTVRSGYREATVIIDMIDAKGKELIWRGWAEESIAGPSISEKTIARAVGKILKQFPPGK